MPKGRGYKIPKPKPMPKYKPKKAKPKKAKPKSMRNMKYY